MLIGVSTSQSCRCCHGQHLHQQEGMGIPKARVSLAILSGLHFTRAAPSCQGHILPNQPSGLVVWTALLRFHRDIPSQRSMALPLMSRTLSSCFTTATFLKRNCRPSKRRPACAYCRVCHPPVGGTSKIPARLSWHRTGTQLCHAWLLRNPS